MCKLVYTVYGDGYIETALNYDIVKELGDMPEFGVMFKVDADYNQVKWYGMGPEETYIEMFVVVHIVHTINLKKAN